MKNKSTMAIGMVVFCLMMMASSAAWAGGPTYEVTIINKCRMGIGFNMDSFHAGLFGNSIYDRISSTLQGNGASVKHGLKAGYQFGSFHWFLWTTGNQYPQAVGNKCYASNVLITIEDVGAESCVDGTCRCYIGNITTY